MDDLKTFIQTTRDSRELKRALAVQNTLEGHPWQTVAEELSVCRAFIGKWRKQYEQHGVEGLRLGYRPWQGYLDATKQQAIVSWIQEQAHWDIRRLAQEVERRYGVVYKSKQSYYALLNRAKLSWKKTQKCNPSGDPTQVTAKRDELQKKHCASGCGWWQKNCCGSLWINAICSGETRSGMRGGHAASGSRSRYGTRPNARPIMGRSI